MMEMPMDPEEGQKTVIYGLEGWNGASNVIVGENIDIIDWTLPTRVDEDRPLATLVVRDPELEYDAYFQSISIFSVGTISIDTAGGFTLEEWKDVVNDYQRRNPVLEAGE